MEKITALEATLSLRLGDKVGYVGDGASIDWGAIGKSYSFG